MHKFFLKIFYGSLITALFFAVASVASAQTGESIRSFAVEARVNADSTVDFVERIRYDFGSEERHGIFRDIPVEYDSDFGSQSIKLSDIEVKDEAGEPYRFAVSSEGRYKRVKIGDPDIAVSGIKTYVISYTADRAIGFFDGHDELYWNATGNEWQVPIESAIMTITVPWVLDQNAVTPSCYFGPFGSNTQCMTEVNIVDGSATMATFRAPASLGPYEGLTGALGFPKGLLHEPTRWEKALGVVRDNLIVLLPFIVFAFMFRRWREKGRDPAGRGVVVPEYDSPDRLSPLEISGLMHQGMRAKDISAEIIGLAVGGHIDITRIEKEQFIGKKTDYELKKKDSRESLSAIDSWLLDKIFADKDVVLLSDLKSKFYKNVSDLKKKVMESLVSKGYYPEAPEKARMPYIFGAVGIFVLLWAAVAFGLGALGVAAFVASGIVVLVFAIIMPKVTEKGAHAKERVKGLKEYLRVAEKDRIEFHNAPEKNPKLFEKLLPFAMVLGVEKAWAREFEGMLETPPSWYHDPSGRAFSSMAFAGDLSSFNSAVVSDMASAPGSSSGAGGGGFSGGGGGGGGGGSW